MIKPLAKSLEPTHKSRVAVLGQEFRIGFDREPVNEDAMRPVYYYEAVSVLLGGDWYALAEIFTEDVCDMIQKEYDGAPE